MALCRGARDSTHQLRVDSLTLWLQNDQKTHHDSSPGSRFIASRCNATINSHCAIWSEKNNNCAAVKGRERHLLAGLRTPPGSIRPSLVEEAQ